MGAEPPHKPALWKVVDWPPRAKFWNYHLQCSEKNPMYFLVYENALFVVSNAFLLFLLLLLLLLLLLFNEREISEPFKLRLDILKISWFGYVRASKRSIRWWLNITCKSLPSHTKSFLSYSGRHGPPSWQGELSHGLWGAKKNYIYARVGCHKPRIYNDFN